MPSPSRLLLPGATAPGVAAPAPDDRAGLPTKVVVRDSRTSPDDADIASVEMRSSWYWISEHDVVVSVPDGMRAGQHLTVWVDTTSTRCPRAATTSGSRRAGARPGIEQVLRKGETWGTDGTPPPDRFLRGRGGRQAGVRRRAGDTGVGISFDVFGCFGAHPPGDSPGAWRTVVSLTRGAHGDSAPNGRRWSPALRGWQPCDPSGGSCP